MKKSSKSLVASTVLAIAMLACSVMSQKADNSQKTTQTTQGVMNTAEVISTEEIVSTPEGEKPFDLIGVWKSDNLHAPDNSWNISYSVYFQFTNTKQYVYHGVDTFTSNQPTDVSDIVYVNINDSTFIKKLVNIPDHPEALGKFQKWTWRFDNGNVLFTVYGMVDSQELALNDSTITALATGVKVQQPQTDTLTSIPLTQEPAILIKLSPGKFGHTIWIDVSRGDYKLTSGATLRAGSSIGIEESWMTFPTGLAIDVEGGNITLKGTNYPSGTKLLVNDQGNLMQR